MRAQRLSMVQAAIHDGDALVANWALEAIRGRIFIAIVNRELTVRFLFWEDGRIMRIAANPNFPTIEFKTGGELLIWDVITSVLHKV